MNDNIFLTNIIVEICDYAIENKLGVDDTLETVANDILSLLEVCSFDNWKSSGGK